MVVDEPYGLSMAHPLVAHNCNKMNKPLDIFDEPLAWHFDAINQDIKI